jgi:DNA-binding MarR family transcriptional regulator
MELDSSIEYLLQHVSFVMGRQLDQVLQEQLGIGTSQYKILRVLQEQPHIQQRKLAEHLGQTEASISRQIKIMLEKGLLNASVNPENKREHITVPTPRGEKLASAARDVTQKHAWPAFAALNDKQKRQLIDMLKQIHAWTCQPGKLTSCDHPFGL